VAKRLDISDAATFLKEVMKLDQMYAICILQGTVATFFKRGGQEYNHFCKISSGFCVPKIIRIG